jgi:hypothetical protein
MDGGMDGWREGGRKGEQQQRWEGRKHLLGVIYQCWGQNIHVCPGSDHLLSFWRVKKWATLFLADSTAL